MNDAQLVVDVNDGLDKLSEYDGRFILLQEAVLFGVVEEITLVHQFSHDEQTGLGLKLSDELDDIRMMAVL